MLGYPWVTRHRGNQALGNVLTTHPSVMQWSRISKYAHLASDWPVPVGPTFIHPRRNNDYF